MPVEGEFGGVVEHQDQRATAADSVLGRLKMPAQNLFLADARVGEESVRRFGIRPVLTRPRDAAPDVTGKLSQKLSQPRGVAFIAKTALRQFALHPIAARFLCLFPPLLLLHTDSSPLCTRVLEVPTLMPNLLPHLVFAGAACALCG